MFYGKRVDVGYMRRVTDTGRNGTTALGMKEGAALIGISLNPVRSEIREWEQEDWNTLPVPAICHRIMKSGLCHYVVIYEVKNGMVTYMDPVDGRIHNDDWQIFSKEASGVFLLSEPSEDFMPDGMNNSRVKFLKELVCHYRKYIGISFLCAILIMSFSLGLSFLSGWIMDYLSSSNSNHILTIAILLFSMVVTVLMLNIFNIWYKLNTGKHIDNTLAEDFCFHIFRLPSSFFDSMSAGEAVSRIIDISRIKGFITEGVSGVTLSAFAAVGSLVILTCLSVSIGLCAATLIPVYTIICHYVNRYLRKNRMKMMESQARMTSLLAEHVSMAVKTKQLNRETFAAEEIVKAYNSFTSIGYKGVEKIQYSSIGMQAFVTLTTIMLIIIAAHYISSGLMTIGDVVILLTVFSLYSGSLMTVIVFFLSWPEIRSAADRLTDIMSQDEESFDGLPLKGVISFNDISFRDVSFAYGYGEEVLKNLSFTAHAGEITVLHGHNGAGKSTVAKLLLKLYTIKEGEITIDGQPIENIAADSLRKEVGYSEQPAAIYSTSIRDNVLCGIRATDQEVIDVLNRTAFRMGSYSLDTLLGENGSSLSGGENQKISIARILLRKPSVLVLDEPTAYADHDGFLAIQRIIMEEKRLGHTVILITHDERLLSLSDKSYNI